MIHIFSGGQRAFYDLEALWADAPIVKWVRTARKRVKKKSE